MIKIILPLIFLSSPVFGETLKNSYDKLNEAYAKCTNLERDADLSNVNNEWLQSLSDRDQIIVLRSISRKAYDNCVKPESLIFSYDIVRAAINGDSKPLDNYIKLMELSNTQIELDKKFSQFNPDKIKTLLNNPLLNQPFNARTAFEQINNRDYTP